MGRAGRAPGAWALAEQPGRDGFRRAVRVDVPWWFANLDSVAAFGLAALLAVIAPTWTRTAAELLAWEAGALTVVVWGLRTSRITVGVDDARVRVYRWWGNRDVDRGDVERFTTQGTSGRFPRDALSIVMTSGDRLTVGRINIPRWGSSRLTDDRAQAAAASVPLLIDDLERWRTSAG